MVIAEIEATPKHAHNRRPEVVVVTGATAGVGRAVVRQFAGQGAAIGLLARDEKRLEATRREVEELGGQAVAAPTDVANHDAVEEAADQVEQQLGPIDIWINDAMTTIFAPFHEISPEDYRRATEVTYLGFVWGTMAALRRMRPRNRGTIVQVGSALSYRAIPLQSPYCAAKHAIRGFTDSLRCELMHDGSDVHITMVQLPAVNTPQFEWCKAKLPNQPQPVPPIFEPELIAQGVDFAAHARRREFTIGWPAVKAIWGNKFVPSLADRFLAKTAYAGQQTDEPIPPDRPSNLYQPVPGDHGARGRFNRKAQLQSVQYWLNAYRAPIAAGAAAGLAIAGLLRCCRNGD